MTHTKSPFISQSECKSTKCGLRWFGQWHLGLRAASSDGPAQRIGSMAHAISATAYALGCSGGGEQDIAAEAVARENETRKWWDPEAGEPDWLDDELACATLGATTMARYTARGTPVRIDDDNGTVLIEHRMHADWESLLRVGLDPRIVNRLWRLGRAGIEGQMDMVHRMDGVVYVDDYKFRQRPDLGGTLGRPDSQVVDPQGAFYEVLLRAAGVVRDEPVVFRQVNTYAGKWLTVDDFVDDQHRAQRTGGRGTITIDSGLPARDFKRLGAMVDADVWAEAHRILANLRHDARMETHGRRLAEHAAHAAANPKSRRKPPVAPDRLTAAEEYDARRFIDELRNHPLVQEQRCPLDHQACLEVVRDMLASVLAMETMVEAGITPGRNLDPHPRGDCMRPYGCDLRGPCLASLGSNNAAEVFRAHAEDGRLRLAVLPDGVGDDPAERDAADHAAVL